MEGDGLSLDFDLSLGTLSLDRDPSRRLLDLLSIVLPLLCSGPGLSGVSSQDMKSSGSMS